MRDSTKNRPCRTPDRLHQREVFLELDVVKDKTEVGSYFVSNYPPFSAWQAGHVTVAKTALETPFAATIKTPVGLYIHIPFCRKRCRFCYFRVYTDKNSTEVEEYLTALSREMALYAECESLAGRDFEFVYFGGGTPSFLSNDQLKRLVDDIAKHWTWERASEVTFECEPGTLKKSKLETIRAIGVTRVSLGVEHFDDEILATNGRAHKSPEILQSYEWAKEVGFQQINIDLIAGMVGDTDKTWKETVAKAINLNPDSVTIYQMEVPHNSNLAVESKTTGSPNPVADWPTKRRWVEYAFREFEQAGYEISSAYTLVKPSEHSAFVYRDAVWHGADMIGTGVASFSHLQGVHYQNLDSWDDYISSLSKGKLPLARALPINNHQQMIREFILQCKLGRLDASYFRDKFGVDVLSEFKDALHGLVNAGLADLTSDQIVLTRQGLLQVDGLLPGFFEASYQSTRYT